MQQETIVHFLCFTTEKDTETFTALWKAYASTLRINKTKTVLFKQIKTSKNSFSYIIKFELPEENFQLPVMSEHKTGRFSENGVRVLSIGGYAAVKEPHTAIEDPATTTVIAFVQHSETDIANYHELPLYTRLSIHQAYYENCSYGYIMEFVVPVYDAETLLQMIEKKPAATAALYRNNPLKKIHPLAALV